MEICGDGAKIHADYLMNLVGRLTIGGRCINLQALRKGILYFSEISRNSASMKDAFLEVPPAGSVRVKYTVEGCVIRVDMDLREVTRCAEVVVLNEQGANYFDSFSDSDGLHLAGEAIESWDEVYAKEASFVDSMYTIRLDRA